MINRQGISRKVIVPRKKFTNRAISAVMKEADRVIRSWRKITSEEPKMPPIEPVSDTCPEREPVPKPMPGEPKKEFDVQEEADRARDLAVSKICMTAHGSLTSLTADRPKWEVDAVLAVARSAIEAFGSAAQITPEMDVPTTEVRRKADETRIEGTKALIERISQEEAQRRDSISAVNSAVNLDAEVRFKPALIEMIQTQAVARLAELKAQADQAASALNAEIQELTLRQQRVRFVNETVDRHFVITLEVDRKELLDAFTDEEACPAGKEQDACELKAIQEKRYENSVDLAFSGNTNVTVTLTVPPGSPGEIDAWLLSKAPKDIVPSTSTSSIRRTIPPTRRATSRCGRSIRATPRSSRTASSSATSSRA